MHFSYTSFLFFWKCETRHQYLTSISFFSSSHSQPLLFYDLTQIHFGKIHFYFPSSNSSIFAFFFSSAQCVCKCFLNPTLGEFLTLNASSILIVNRWISWFFFLFFAFTFIYWWNAVNTFATEKTIQEKAWKWHPHTDQHSFILIKASVQLVYKEFEPWILS